jgi:hypothetical protein
MAIAPNTTFVSGAVLTAAQMNALPFGVVALTTKTTNSAITSTETIFLSATFTAIANRYYRITYYEPRVSNDAAVGNENMVFRIRNGATTAGTELQSGFAKVNATFTISPFSVIAVNTFTAGSQTVSASMVISANVGTATHSATSPAILLVEDIGPA